MSEEKKQISVTDFMESMNATREMSSSIRSSIFDLDLKEDNGNIILPIADLDKEDQKAIERELKKQESQVDIGDLKIRSLIGVIPLEPVIIIASLGEAESIGDLKSVGIPGYINPNSGEFFLLDGSVPNSISLKQKVKEYIDNRK